jgi:AcrR family transcriptional regulator
MTARTAGQRPITQPPAGSPREPEQPGQTRTRTGAVDTRSRILQATIDALHRMPIYKLTMNDVANAAGISRRTIYKHFKSKEDLVLSLFVEHITTRQHPEVRRIGALPPDNEHLVDMLVAEHEIGLEHIIISYTADSWLDPNLAELIIRSPEIAEAREATWIPILRHYQHVGIIRPDLDPQKIVRWTTYQQVWFLTHPTALTDSPTELRDYIRDYIVAALTIRSATT